MLTSLASAITHRARSLSESAFERVCAAAELPDRGSRVVEISGQEVLVCNSGGEFFAVLNLCPHAQSPLAGGRIRRGMISCPLHGMLFDLRDGDPKGALTRTPLTTFATRVVDGHIEVAIAADIER